MTTLLCAKCNSPKVVPSARVMDRGHLNSDAGELAVVVYAKPNALIFKGAQHGELYARVCGDCGFTELFVEEPQILYQTYQQSLDEAELANEE